LTGFFSAFADVWYARIMQASVASSASLGLSALVYVDDDFDDAPTREFVAHRGSFGQLDDDPDIFSAELRGWPAALAALMELCASDAARDDDDTPTCEFVVPRFSPRDFDPDQLAALAALEWDDDDIIVDHEEPIADEQAPFDPEPVARAGALAAASPSGVAPLEIEIDRLTLEPVLPWRHVVLAFGAAALCVEVLMYFGIF
jgi:hypothetical protein